MWTLAERWLARALDGALLVVLARLLTPADFGTVAIAAAILALLDVLRDSGFGQAAVQRPVLERGHVNVIFWWSLGLGCLLGGLVYLLADPLGKLFDSSDLPGVIRLLAPALPLQALLVVPTVQLERNLNFKPLAMRGITGMLAGGATGVVLALEGAGAYALVGRVLADLLLSVVLLWAITRSRPGIAFSLRHLQDLLGFGIKIAAYRLLDFAHLRSDDFIIGASLGPALLGIYSVAYRAFRTLTDVLLSTVGRVALPTFSALQQEPKRVRNAYYLAIRFTTMVAVPAFIAIAVVADHLVYLTFGPRWSDAIPVMQVLVLVGVLQSIRHYDAPLLISVARPGTLLLLKAASVTATVVAFLFAAQSGDLVFFAVAYAGVALFISTPLWIWALRRYAGVKPLRTLSVIWPSLAAGTSMAAVGSTVGIVIEPLPRVIEMSIQLLVMATLYAGAIWMLDRDGIHLLRSRLVAVRTQVAAPSTS